MWRAGRAGGGDFFSYCGIAAVGEGCLLELECEHEQANNVAENINMNKEHFMELEHSAEAKMKL